jgi:ribulose-5-phosphate 4-epimerase/fuculose-1-phosphate aldolase
MTNIPSEGVIKFKFSLKRSLPLTESLYIEVEKWRTLLFKMNFIGEYPIEKVGYGNLSKRTDQNGFIITGTQTGHLSNLDGNHYTIVSKCDLVKMNVESTGPIAPSSESLTHYAIYSTCPQIKYIYHVHHKDLWNFMLRNNYDKTSREVEYGTQEMASSAKACISDKTTGIFAMEGHEDGIIAYGTSAEATGKIILDTLKEFKK